MGEAADDVVSATEIERKLDADLGLRFPDLSEMGIGLPPGSQVESGGVVDLEATYFDSSDLRLLGQAITLRRRTGGKDAGWHVKLLRPDGERQELRAPLGRSASTVPVALRRQVAVHLRGASLQPVARLSTRRRLHLIRDAEQNLTAEIADDTVTAVPLHGPEQTWREIEVESLDGDLDLVNDLVSLLVSAGARPSASRSKVGRALGEVPVRTPARTAPGLPRSSAGAALLTFLATQVETLIRLDPAVRADQYDAVHQMRVACRRMRSALSVYRDLVDQARGKALRGELSWLGGLLGAARDTEVIRDLLLDLVGDEPRALIRGPVRRRISTEFRDQYRTHRETVLTALDSERYFALVDALESLLVEAPLTRPAHRPATRVLPVALRDAHRRLLRARRVAERAVDPVSRDAAWHEVRRISRRIRFAAETAESVFGAPAARLSTRMKAVQDVLGAHQDEVIAAAALLDLEQRAHQAGEATFSYGRLHARLQARGEGLARSVARPWYRATRPKLWRAFLSTC
jgi:CHAD domain-containing protein